MESQGANTEQTCQVPVSAVRISDLKRSEPPITKSTLSELDVQRIIFNPKLRHDVNFDPDLHFRPNLDGEKGIRKSRRAKAFWKLFRTELTSYLANPEAFEPEFSGREWSLRATLRAIGEILTTLVPPEDRSAVEEVLSVDYLMQQFSKGAADLEKLAKWLSSTLKLHCAPMRDDWVDNFEKQLTEGNSTGSVTMLVEGLRTVLGVLEAMKLVSVQSGKAACHREHHMLIRNLGCC